MLQPKRGTTFYRQRPLSLSKINGLRHAPELELQKMGQNQTISIAPLPDLAAATQHDQSRNRIPVIIRLRLQMLAPLSITSSGLWYRYVELVRSHIFDHMLTQRTDGVSIAHGSSILSEV
jgi:hypothetical protein